MSATVTMTAASSASTGTSTLTTTPSPTACCPNCGFGADLPPFEESQTALASAQKQIADLEAQVRLLNQKASAAVDRWADYEDELAKLRSQLEARPHTPAPHPTTTRPQHQQTASLPTPPSSTAGLPSPSRASFLTTTAATRISALLTRKSPPPPPPALKPLPTAPSPLTHTRSATFPSPIPSLPSSTTTPNTSGTNLFTPSPTAKSSPLSPPPSLPTSTQFSTEDLLTALSQEQSLRRQAEAALHETTHSKDLLAVLSHEQALRRKAEAALHETHREVEELSASLFEQANEMVAKERRARAGLEERVGVLERRSKEGGRRLERLERAVGRVERVRGLLGEMERMMPVEKAVMG